MISITRTVSGDVSEIALGGRLDVKAASEAEAAFAEAAKEAKNVVLNMADLEYIASAGLRAIKRLKTDVRANGGTLTVRNVQDNVMEVFEMTGFAAMFNIE